MNNRFGMIVILLLAMTLTTYSCYVSAGSDISQAWKGERTSRTWTVVASDIEPLDDFHFQKDDVFRIEETNTDNIRFIPHQVLRGRWDRSENSFIKLNRGGSNNQRLCGKLVLRNHPGPGTSHRPHFILIEADPNDENQLKITINDNVNFNCASATHGGIVHARN